MRGEWAKRRKGEAARALQESEEIQGTAKVLGVGTDGTYGTHETNGSPRSHIGSAHT
jgi:hypothetical protein